MKVDQAASRRAIREAREASPLSILASVFVARRQASSRRGNLSLTHRSL
jgi:hypothetical protein